MVCRLFLVSMLLAANVFAAEDFYEQQLQAGKLNYQSNRLPAAADELRVAAFGLLHKPALLAEALTRLAVVQSALGRTTEATKSIDRFMDVERQFAPYVQLQVEPAVRSKFEELLVNQIPRNVLQATPSLARLANYELQKIAQMPPAQRIAAYEAGAKREPRNAEWFIALTREAFAREQPADVVRWGARVIELEPSNKEVRPMLARARTMRRECRDALALMKEIDLTQYPDVQADNAVCLVELTRWKEAETALATVPAKLKNRPDVRRAMQLVTRASETAKADAMRIAAAEKLKADRLKADRLKADRERADREKAEAARIAASKTPQRPPQPSSVSRPAMPQSSSSVAAPKAAETLETSRRLVRDGKYSEAVQRLRSVSTSEPENRSVRLALLEAAVLARDWRTAASQVPVVTPLTSGEELYMFYASVALYETGRHDEARTFMEKARPRMVPSPMVDHYVKAVLGQQRGG